MSLCPSFVAFRIPGTLKLRLAALVMLMLAAGLWAFALVVADDQERRQRELLESQQYSNVGYVAEDIENKIQLRVRGLEMIADRFPLDALRDTGRVRDFLAERRAIYNLFNGGLIVVKPDGSGAFGDYPPMPERLTNRYDTISPFKDVIATGRSTIGPPRIGRAVGAPLVVIAAPIKDDKGVLRAVLAGVTRIDAPQFLDLITKPRGRDAGDYLVAAPDHGVFVTGTDPVFTLRALPSRGTNAMHDRYMDGYEGSGLMRDPTGIEELTSARRVPSANWFVVARLPTEIAFAPLRESRRLMIGAATVLTLLIGAITLLALRRALRPLEQAAKEMRAMTRGDVPLHPLPIAHRDEIGDLTESFNRLQEHIAARRVAEAAVFQAEQRFAVVFRTSPIPIAIARVADGCFVEVNEALLTLFGRVRNETVGKNSVEIGYWPDAASRQRWLDELKRTGALHNHPVTLCAADGERRHILMSSSFLQFGGEPCIVNFLLDVTEQRRAESDTRLLAKIFSHSHDGMTITDGDATVLDVNPAFTRLTGYTREEVVGKNPRVLQSGRHDVEFYRRMWTALKLNGTWRGEIWNRKKNGELIAEMLTINAVPTDRDGEIKYIGIFTDITPLKMAQADLERKAHYDPLTHLPNRTLLRDRLTQALAQAKRRTAPLAVCFIDLDGFKPVNDEHGHNAGDHLLIEIADRLRTTIRDADTVARLGGDEFVVVLGSLNDRSELDAILQRLVRAIAQPCHWEEHRLRVSASIGVALYPEAGDDPDLLVHRADLAMYAAKQEGRDRYRLFAADLEAAPDIAD